MNIMQLIEFALIVYIDIGAIINSIGSILVDRISLHRCELQLQCMDPEERKQYYVGELERINAYEGYKETIKRIIKWPTYVAMFYNEITNNIQQIKLYKKQING